MFNNTVIVNNDTDEKDVIVNSTISRVAVPGTSHDSYPIVTYTTKHHGTMEASELFETWHAVIEVAKALAPIVREWEDGNGTG